MVGFSSYSGLGLCRAKAKPLGIVELGFSFKSNAVSDNQLAASKH